MTHRFLQLGITLAKLPSIIGAFIPVPMTTHAQSEKAYLHQLQESMNALATTFSDFKISQDQRHESYLNSFQTLQTQIQNQKPVTIPSVSSSSIEPMKPPKLILRNLIAATLLNGCLKQSSFLNITPLPSLCLLLHVR